MEIVNKKQIKKFVKIILFLMLIIVFVPIYLYVKMFSGSFSTDPQDWSNFGGYIGGVIGTIFSFIAALFSLLSIYITLKISTKIYEEEEKLHKKNETREKEKFEREIDLITKQNKPLLYVHEDFSKRGIIIFLENHGVGSLNITKWQIEYDGAYYNDFYKLFYNKTSFELNEKDGIIEWNNSAKHIISPSGKKILFTLSPINNPTEEYVIYLRECLSFLNKTTLHFEYQDIFENDFKETYVMNILQK